MTKKGLAVCLLLAACLFGCRLTVLFIEDIQQPSNVCLDRCFQTSVQSKGVAFLNLEDGEEPPEITILAEGMASAVFLPEGWQVLSCVVSGDATGPCEADASVAWFADYWSTAMGIYTTEYGPSIPPGMTWHGYSRIIDGPMNELDLDNPPENPEDFTFNHFTFTWTIRPTTPGSFKLLYFSGGGVLVDSEEEEPMWIWYPVDIIFGGSPEPAIFSSFASRSIESTKCAVPALSDWGTAVLFALFLVSGLFLIGRNRKRSAGMTASILLFIAMALLCSPLSVQADGTHPLTMKEGMSLCAELKQNPTLQAQFLGDIKGFFESWFDLTEKQRIFFQNLPEATLEAAARKALECQGGCPAVFLSELMKKK